MGNVFAAGLERPSAVTGGLPPPTAPAPPVAPPGASEQPIVRLEDLGVGTFEELHKRCKDLFPVPFEGAKLLVNKGLSNHFQISHTITMSTLQPSGYRFGCTYVGTKQFSPVEAYPILIGDIDASGNLNANIIHQFTERIKCKLISQIQDHKCVAAQLVSEYRGSDFTAAVTVGNPDIINGSGVLVSNYLQSVSTNLALGAELLYQFGPALPGGHIGVYTLGGRYSGDGWQVSSKLTPLAGALTTCYYHKLGEGVQVGLEMEGSLRTRECTTTLGYQIDLANAGMTFRGQVDSNWCVSAVMEKKLPSLPFTFALSAFANHTKGSYRFGVGLIVG